LAAINSLALASYVVADQPHLVLIYLFMASKHHHIQDCSGIVHHHQHKTFEPIIQVLDFTNELFSSKFQVPGPGALVGERGT
jgi:hypothetical protein